MMSVIRIPSKSRLLTVSDVTEILYRSMIDLNPDMLVTFGLQIREWILELKETDFGHTNIDRLVRFETLLAEYEKTTDKERREQIKVSINGITNKLFRKSKAL